MNCEMAYLIGMILGNGEIQRGAAETTVTIEIPYKNLRTDACPSVAVYVKASTVDVREIIEPLIGHRVTISQVKNATRMSFTMGNDTYVIREIFCLIGKGTHHSNMTMGKELFAAGRDARKALLKGIADVTGHIRYSNYHFNKKAHRVYIEVPQNWQMVIDIANMLKSVGIPVQNIDFGHPNFRDGKLKEYNAGNLLFWKKEHQIKIYANEFLPIGFNIQHKQSALEQYSNELLEIMTPEQTHRFYWEKPCRRSNKPIHPGENDESLPPEIRGRHFSSWTELAAYLGYGK